MQGLVPKGGGLSRHEVDGQESFLEREAKYAKKRDFQAILRS